MVLMSSKAPLSTEAGEPTNSADSDQTVYRCLGILSTNKFSFKDRPLLGMVLSHKDPYLDWFCHTKNIYYKCFKALSRIFHLFQANCKSKVGEKQELSQKNPPDFL